MASKNINIALFLTINLVFFGFTMSQDPVPQAPTCPSSSTTQFETCVSRIIDTLDSVFLVGARLCCLSLTAGLDASVASVCICDAVKLSVAELADPFFEQTDLFRRVTNVCFISPPAGFTCA
ncbi:hypothetical protein N665_0078s0103 [Sinapis alba]|nr:hypothetical protein N665_0078s0103 [Sinapis alba]